MWNELNLSEPVQDLCEYGLKDSKTLAELPELINLLTSAAEWLTEDHPIWEEINIFRNIQAKYKRILQCDKCLQLLQRVGTCLRKMVLLKLSNVYLNLAEKIITEIQNPKDVYFLPSRQQLEFVLIRTQSAAKLICESLHYSREAFCYLIQRLKVGHLVINLMMATSVTARLNIVFKGLLIQVFDFYKNIYLWRKKLRKGGWEWPKPLELPEDLETWFSEEDSDYLKPKHLPKEELDFLTSIFDENSLTEEPNAEDNEDILMDSSKLSEDPPVIAVEDDCMALDKDAETDNIDNGVVIERSDMDKELCDDDVYVVDEPSQNGGGPKKKKKSKHVTVQNEESQKKKKASKHVTVQNEESQKKKKASKPVTVQNEDSRKKKKADKPNTVQNEDSRQRNKADKPVAELNEGSRKKTKAQKLLKKIKNAEEMKDLKVIWDNLDFNSPNLLPKILTPEIIRLIDKLFNKMKNRISQINASHVSVTERDGEVKFLVKIARLKFAKYLGLLQNKKETNKTDAEVLKPATTFKELRTLYETLYHRLQTAQKYKKCARLKKSFKNCKADMSLLVENEEKETAKKLISDTSKLFLSKYV